MEYQLELKQIVDFPRCRIYRNFIQTLLNDRSIRTALTGRMDLQHLRTAGLVPLPVPASGGFHPGASPGGRLHYLFAAGEKAPGPIPDHRLAERQYGTGISLSLQKGYRLFLFSYRKSPQADPDRQMLGNGYPPGSLDPCSLQ